MKTSLKPYGFYVVCSLLPLFFLWLPWTWFQISSDLLTFLSYLPYLLLGVVAYFGLRLNQTRIFWSAVYLLGSYFLMQHMEFLKPVGIGKIRLPQILSVALPAALLIAWIPPEGRFRSDRTGKRIFWSFLPFIGLVVYLNVHPASFQRLFEWSFLPWNSRLPDLFIFPALGLLAFSLFTKDSATRLFRRALFLSLIPIWSALHVSLTPAAPAQLAKTYFFVAFAAAAVSVFHAVFHLYWQRVYLDALTEIPNRRALEEKLEHLSPPYAVVMVDVDHFKSFNDTYGHEEGDNVLRMVGRYLFQESGERAFRYGGEEFCLLFEGKGIEETSALAEALRRGLEKRKFYLRLNPSRRPTSRKERGKKWSPGKPLHVTASFGVAQAPVGNAFKPAEVLKKADHALYEAKRKGRNRVQTA